MGMFDTKSSSTSTTRTVEELRDPMMQGVQGAAELYGRGGYTGPFVAGINPLQMLGSQGYVDAAQGFGDLGRFQYDTGRQLTQGFGQATDAYGRYMDPEGVAAQNVNIAGMLSNNPYLDQMIDASSRDVVRNLNWNQLPGLASSFAATGGTDSSKYAQQNILAQQMAGDRIADVSAGLRGSAWQQGLSQAQNMQNLGFSAANAQANLAGQGMQYMQQGQQNLMQPSVAQMAMGDYQRNLDQSIIEGDRMAWQAPWDNLNQYGNYINPLAQTFTTTTTNGVQKRNTAGVLAGMGANLMGASIMGGAGGQGGGNPLAGLGSLFGGGMMGGGGSGMVGGGIGGGASGGDGEKDGWGGAASGVMSGAATGSAFGPWGTVIGGVIGGIGGYFGDSA